MSNNVRAFLHVIAAAAGAIAAGTIGFVGLSEVWNANIVAVAGLVVLVINTYLASTTTGRSIAHDKGR